MIVTLGIAAAAGYAALRTLEALGKKAWAWMKGAEAKVAAEVTKVEGEVKAKL